MNDSFGDFNATQTATAGAASEQKAEGIAPIVFKQINETPEGRFQMYGITFGMVCAVAIVRNIETSSTKITYLLEDHTGRIEAHYWLEEGDTMKAPDVMLNNYVKVYGTVRPGGQKTLMILRMVPVLDPNELCTHLLEVMHVRYKSEDLQNKLGGGAGDFVMGGGSDIKAGNGGGNFESSGSTMGLEGKQLAVFTAIKGHASEEGISRRELKSKFTQISETELNSILDFMIFEGHIYSSIDPDHFLSTE